MAQVSPFTIPEMLTRRLALLRALAASLEQVQATMATTTPAQLDRQTAHQRELCRQLCALAHGVRGEVRLPLSPELADDLHQTARRLGELNRNYAALLRRRRRTVDIFCRVLASSGTTYPAPKLVSQRDLKATKAKG